MMPLKRRCGAALICAAALAATAAAASDTIPMPQPEYFNTLTWTQAFESFHAKFSREYAFTDWKSVDWTALRGQALPQIQAAELTDDTSAYLTALRRYTLSIPDGHISIKSPGRSGDHPMERASDRDRARPSRPILEAGILAYGDDRL